MTMDSPLVSCTLLVAMVILQLSCANVIDHAGFSIHNIDGCPAGDETVVEIFFYTGSGDPYTIMEGENIDVKIKHKTDAKQIERQVSFDLERNLVVVKYVAPVAGIYVIQIFINGIELVVSRIERTYAAKSIAVNAVPAVPKEMACSDVGGAAYGYYYQTNTDV